MLFVIAEFCVGVKAVDSTYGEVNKFVQSVGGMTFA